MTFDDFSKHQRKRNAERLEMSDAKGRAYAGPHDRFDNFNRLSKLLSIPREHVLLVYLMKHIDAIISTVTTGEDGNESVESRVDDAVTYLELLDGMLHENKSPPFTMEEVQEALKERFDASEWNTVRTQEEVLRGGKPGQFIEPPTKYVWRNPDGSKGD